MTIEHIERMRQWIITLLSTHALHCDRCRELLPCKEIDRLLALLRKWSLLDIAMYEQRTGER